MSDQSTMAPAAVTVRRTYAAPREKVFKAWTEPMALKSWFAPSPAHTTPLAEVDLRPGGRYRIHMQSPSGDTFRVGGTYQEILPPEKLVFTWKWEESEIEPNETLVTVEFHELGAATEMVLTHERFSSKIAGEEHGKGWAGCLSALEAYLSRA